MAQSRNEIEMAITKIVGAIHPPKTGGRYKVLKNAINYALDDRKTAHGLYTGSINCFKDSALANMIQTKEFYGKTSSAQSERLGYHFIISCIKKRIAIKNKPLLVLPPISGMVYAIPMEYWKKYTKTLTPLQKQYYARLYRLGLRKKDVYPDYYTIQENLKKMREMNKKIELIREYGIYDTTTAQAAVRELKDKIVAIRQEKSGLFEERSPYVKLLELLKEKKSFGEGYTAFLNGNQECEGEYQEYIQLENKIKKHGISEEELMKYQDSIKETLKSIGRKEKSIWGVINRIEDIMEDLYSSSEPVDIEVLENMDELEQKKEEKISHKPKRSR